MKKQIQEQGQPGSFIIPGGDVPPRCNMSPETNWSGDPAGMTPAGQSAAEFGLVVMLAVLMFLGMVQFGLYLYGLSIVENAARHGARMGSVSQACAPCDASTAAMAALNGQPVIRDPGVEILAPGGIVGSTVQIRVTAKIPMVMPGGDLFGMERLTTVTSESTFRQEGW